MKIYLRLIVFQIVLFYVGINSTVVLGQNNKIKNDLNTLKLKGTVKSLIEIKYYVFDSLGKIVKDGIAKKDTILFSETGNKIKDFSVNSVGVFYYKYNFKYNYSGKLVEKTNFRDDTKETYTYDSLGKLIDRYRYYLDTLPYHDIFKYDKKGNNIGLYAYDPYGISGEKYFFSYNVNGNIIEQQNYDSQGICWSKIIFKYDKLGKLIEESGYNRNGSLDSKAIYKYDNNGNSLKNYFYFYEDHKIRRTSTTEFDAKGNEIKEIFYNSDGTLDYMYTYKYVYDNNGNWINKTDFLNNNIQTLIERQIIYY